MATSSQKVLNSSNSTDLKNEIAILAQTRQKIEKGNDVSGSMVKLNKTLGNIKPLLKKQENYIKNFFTHQQSTNPENKDSQIRRYVSRIGQIAMKDINDLLDVGQQYFTIDFKNNWSKIKSSFEKQFNALRQQIDQKNMIQLLFKVINVKDFLNYQFMKSILYRKIVLWKDLNISDSGFVHSEMKGVFSLIDQQILQKGYVPTKPVFDWMGMGVKGNWTMNKLDTPQFDLKYMLMTANQSVETALSVLRNYANLTVEQRSHQDIDRNRERVKSLRQEIEDAKVNYLVLEKKYRQAFLKDEKSDIVYLKQKVSNLEEAIQQKQHELKKIRFQFRDSSNEINSLKDKIKQLEADLSRITNQQFKKLKQIQSIQTGLADQFERIYKNVGSFGSMFEFESDGKKELVKQILSHEKTIEKLVDMLNREKKKTKSQSQEIIRLNTIILELGEKFRDAI